MERHAAHYLVFSLKPGRSIWVCYEGTGVRLGDADLRAPALNLLLMTHACLPADE